MFVVLEMTDDQITARLLAYLTGISMDRLDRDELSLEDRAKIEEAFREIDSWDFMVYCDPTMTVSDIRAIQMRERFDLIIVDYLQRMDFENFNEIPRFAKMLKNIALTTKCSIDLFSQLQPKAIDNRSQNPFSKPDNNSLYGGKATAFEADNVSFLWAHRAVDEHGGWNNRTGYGDLIFAKVRQGRPGLEVPMQFSARHVQWEERT
jgi:replicative DNA helicase